MSASWVPSVTQPMDETAMKARMRVRMTRRLTRYSAPGGSHRARPRQRGPPNLAATQTPLPTVDPNRNVLVDKHVDARVRDRRRNRRRRGHRAAVDEARGASSWLFRGPVRIETEEAGAGAA